MNTSQKQKAWQAGKMWYDNREVIEARDLQEEDSLMAELATSIGKAVSCKLPDITINNFAEVHSFSRLQIGQRVNHSSFFNYQYYLLVNCLSDQSATLGPSINYVTR